MKLYHYLIILSSLILFSGCYSNTSIAVVNEPLDVNLAGQLDVSYNIWNNTNSGVNGVSNIVDTLNYPYISIFGSTSGATTLSVFVSSDGINFYLCEDLSTKINAPLGNTFHIFFSAGARYYRLSSSSNVIINATLSAKP